MSDLERRRFLGLCGALSLAAASRPLYAAPVEGMSEFGRARLVDASGAPIRASLLEVGQDYLFHYPFVGTPCLLANLGEPPQAGVPLETVTGARYRSLPGVGPEQSIVAFTAICTHLMTHPNKTNSFINYYHDGSNQSGRDKVIACCAHGTVFDPTQGGRVMTGEAKQPLPSIALEYDEAEDALFAVGVYGDAQLFRHFFNVFRRDLVWRFGRRQAQRKVEGTASLMRVAAYTQQKVSC